MAQFDAKKLTTNEWGIVGGSAAAFVFLIFKAYKVSVSGAGSAFGSLGSQGLSGWHFKGLWMPVLLLLAAAGLLVLRKLKPEVVPTLPVGTALIVLAVAAFAVLCVLLRTFTYPGGSENFGTTKVSAGAGIGSYLVLLSVIVAAVFAFLHFKTSGEKLPDFTKGTGTATPPPPAI